MIIYFYIYTQYICFYHMYDCLYFLFFLIIYYQNIYYIYINHFDTFFIENHVIISVSFICVECFGFGLESPSIQCTRSRDCMVINRPSCLIYLKNDIPGINFLSINNYIMEKCHLFQLSNFDIVGIYLEFKNWRQSSTKVYGYFLYQCKITMMTFCHQKKNFLNSALMYLGVGTLTYCNSSSKQTNNLQCFNMLKLLIVDIVSLGPFERLVLSFVQVVFHQCYNRH